VAHRCGFGGSVFSMSTRGRWHGRLRLIDLEVHTPIVLHTHFKAASVLLARAQERKNSTASISHMNVFTSLGGWPNALDLPLPHQRFFVLSLASLMAGFSYGSRLTQKGFLRRDPQNVLAARFHGYHRLQQIALMGCLFANLTSPACFGMQGTIHFGGILDQ